MKRLKDLLSTYDTEPVELLLAVLALIWGVWLMLPWSTFGTSLVWSTAASIAPEEVWAIAFTSLGLAQLWIVINAANGPSKYAAMFGCGLWAFMAASFWASVPTSTGPIVYTLISVVNGWIYLRHAKALR